MGVKTNNNWRFFMYRSQVPPDVLSREFDYLSDEDIDGFFTYKGRWYHLSQFTRTTIKGWDGLCATSFFSGIVIKLSDDGEQYRVGVYTT